jgi:hypothetical protein
VFSEEELERESNTQKMRVPFSDKPVPYYSHDVIISVGDTIIITILSKI